MSTSLAIKKILRNYRDYGLGVTLGKTTQRLVSFVFEARTYRIYRIHLDRYKPENTDRGGFTFSLLDWSDEKTISQIENMEEWLSGKIHEKLLSGSICFLALDGDRLAGFNLVSFGSVDMPIIRMTRKFRPNEAWSEQITVSRDYRGRGLATILRRSVFVFLKERGITKFYGGTLLLNTANRKLSKKVGFQEVADIRYRHVLNRRTWTYNRVIENDKKN